MTTNTATPTCSIDGCDAPRTASGRCAEHAAEYQRAYYDRKKGRSTKCSVVNCKAPPAPGSSWCDEHLDLFRAVGRPAVPPVATPARVPDYVPIGRPPMPDHPLTAPQPAARPQRKEAPVTTSKANGSAKPAPARTCSEPGCDQPVYVSEKRRWSRCEEHQRAKWRQHKTGTTERQKPGRKPAKPAAAPVRSEPPPYREPGDDQPVPPPAAQALAVRADGITLERLVREALASNSDALSLTITGVTVRFEGELTL